MSRLSRNKGKRGERQVRDLFRDFGLIASRGQQFAGSPDSPDVIVPAIAKDYHIEVKWVEGIVGAKMRAAIDQSTQDAAGKAWTVFHKENDHRWLVTLDARDFIALLTKVLPPEQPSTT